MGVVSIINLLLNREGAANAIAGIIGETNYSSAIFIVGAVISALVMLAVVAFGLSIILISVWQQWEREQRFQTASEFQFECSSSLS